MISRGSIKYSFPIKCSLVLEGPDSALKLLEIQRGNPDLVKYTPDFEELAHVRARVRAHTHRRQVRCLIRNVLYRLRVGSVPIHKMYRENEFDLFHFSFC